MSAHGRGAPGSAPAPSLVVLVARLLLVFVRIEVLINPRRCPPPRTAKSSLESQRQIERCAFERGENTAHTADAAQGAAPLSDE